jgi:hypothetical protein
MSEDLSAVMALLRSIDAGLKAAAGVRTPPNGHQRPQPARPPQPQHRAPQSQPRAPQGQRGTFPEAGTPEDLDGKYGNPTLNFTPRDWNGANYKGSKFSDCPPDLLELVAKALDYFADQSERKGETTSQGKPLAPYKRKDAARARGWAARLTLQGVPAMGDYEDPPFDHGEFEDADYTGGGR